MKARLPEIVFVKGIAIISVLLLHSLPENILDISLDSLHIGQAVPIFLFITFYLSFKGLSAHYDIGALSFYYSP